MINATANNMSALQAQEAWKVSLYIRDVESNFKYLLSEVIETSLKDAVSCRKELLTEHPLNSVVEIRKVQLYI